MLSQNNKKPVIDSTAGGIDLQKLIISAKHGDTEAFAKVYVELYTPLYRYVLSHIQDRELTNDICQQAFLKFYMALDTYEPRKTPLAYLFTVARNLLINYSEKEKLRFAIPFDDALLETFKDDSMDTMERAHIQLLAQSIDTYLSHLSNDEQEVIRLYFYGELEYKEIAEIMSKEEATLRKIKERALQKLRILTSHLYEGK